jgi:formylglycine-generating enzyme required for sulfatase activity
MVYVEGGSFIAGLESDSSDPEDEDSSDVHRVSVSSFFLGKFVVTHGLYRVVMGKKYYNLENEGPDQFPLYRVEWHHAIEFCNRLSDLSGLERVYSGPRTSIRATMTRNGYRLPTVTEWEFAARGGNLAKGFSLGGSPHLATIAWYADNSDSHRHPVGLKAANELGLHDMLGNQTCWCWDSEDSGSSQIDLDDEDAPSWSGGIGSPERCKDSITRGSFYDDDGLTCLKLSKASTYAGNFFLPGFRLARSAGLHTSSEKD